MTSNLEISETPVEVAGLAQFNQQLVNSIISLERFLSEVRLHADRDAMLMLTIQHLKALLPMENCGFYFPNEAGLNFTLGTSMAAEAAAELNELVDHSVESGAFG